MAEFSGNPPGHAGREREAYVIADGRIEVRPAERLAYVDGTPDEGINGRLFQLLSLTAQRAGSLVWSEEAREEIWGSDDAVDKSNLSIVTGKLQERLGPVLGHPEGGAIRFRPTYGVWAAKTLTHRGVIPQPEADSPVRLFANDRLAVYPDQAAVLRDGVVIEDLTVTEYELMAELARRTGRIVGATPLRAVANIKSVSALGNRIGDLRKKLGSDDLGHPLYGAIVTKSGGFVAQRTLKQAKNLSTPR